MLFVLLVYHSHICEIHNMDFRTVCSTSKLIMACENYGECQISDGAVKKFEKRLNCFACMRVGFIAPSKLSGFVHFH